MRAPDAAVDRSRAWSDRRSESFRRTLPLITLGRSSVPAVRRSARCKRSARSSGSTTRPKRPRITTCRFSRTPRSATSRATAMGPGPGGHVMVVTFELDGMRVPGAQRRPACSSSPRRFRSSSTARPRRRSTPLGQAHGRRRARRSAAGSRTSTGCPGRSSRRLGELLADPDADKAGAVMQAMLQMGKIDIEGLQGAYKAVAWRIVSIRGFAGSGATRPAGGFVRSRGSELGVGGLIRGLARAALPTGLGVGGLQRGPASVSSATRPAEGAYGRFGVQPIAGAMWRATVSSRRALKSTPSWFGTVSSRCRRPAPRHPAPAPRRSRRARRCSSCRSGRCRRRGSPTWSCALAARAPK